MPMLETSDFFHQATLRICGSLNIEDSLQESLSFLQKYIPADEIFLNVYNPGAGNLRVLAHATPERSKIINRIFPLPNEVRSLVGLNCSKNKIPKYKVLITNNPKEHIVANFLCCSMNVVNASLLSMFLFIDSSRMGVVDVLAKGYNRFHIEHSYIFSSLQGPFAVAVSNALKNQDIIDIKKGTTYENSNYFKKYGKDTGQSIIGVNTGLQQVMRNVHQVAPKNSTVLIFGETGVGKEVIANAVHNLSTRKSGPFIKVNCGALPENLIDSELFGHEKGAFTGAVNQKKGRFELAHTGTIFLDEIGELPYQAQVRLLHILQNQKVERIGATQAINLDIRVIGATHRDLKAMVSSGEFRQDLWFRLNVFPIHIPALRYRKEDIPALAQHIVQKKCQNMGYHQFPHISKNCMEMLINYNWPGNIRELENILERELIQHDGEIRSLHELTDQNSLVSQTRNNNSVAPLDEAMMQHITAALAHSQGKIHGPHGAAEILGINPNTLRYRMQKLGIPFKKNIIHSQ
jgi:transcriptional regulator with GAF, ATPase, and Fis domain